MITRTEASLQRETWQTALKNAFSSFKDLLAYLELDESAFSLPEQALQEFPLLVPRGFADRMKKGDPQDPLLLQVLPQVQESLDVTGYIPDALGEAAANPIPGMLHKYQDRVLLIPTGGCAVNCRYCFRRHFPYSENNPGRKGWEAALRYIEAHPEIHEVLLSGGDPLLITDKHCADLLEGIARIPHIQRLRFHTRIPIVLPERMTPEFIEILSSTRLKTVIVIHANHPQELNHEVQTTLAAIAKRGIMLLNQSVLLKTINNTVETLVALSQRLFDCGVLPYYLHMPDKVKGTAHFDISLEEARALHLKLQESLSGYLVPRLVVELAGEKSKTLLN